MEDAWEDLWEQTQRSVFRYMDTLGFSPETYERRTTNDEETEKTLIQFVLKADDTVIAQIGLEIFKDVPTLVIQTFRIASIHQTGWHGATAD